MKINRLKLAVVLLCVASVLVSGCLSYIIAYEEGAVKGYNEGVVAGTKNTLTNIAEHLNKQGIILDWHMNDDGSYNLTVTNSDGFRAQLHFEVHALITLFKDGKIVRREYHAGSMTKLGLNATLAKLTGNSTAYNMTQYNLNSTFISVGDQGTLNTDSTELPGEWNRTTAPQHDCTYNSFNLTAWIYPDTGPYTLDCFGVNIESGISNGALIAYDTWTESTGIDDSYDIRIEFRISVV